MCVHSRKFHITRNPFFVPGTTHTKALNPVFVGMVAKKEKEEYSFGMRTSKSKEVKELDPLW